MCFRLTRDGEWCARTSHDQSIACDGEWCTAFFGVTCQRPELLIGSRCNACHLAYTQIQLHLSSHPLNILRPFIVGGTCAPAINPIGIAQLVGEESLPGEVNHLFRDCAAQLFVSPAG